MTKSGQGENAGEFDLLKIANKTVVHQLMQAGVKKVTLDIHAFETSLLAKSAKDKSLISSAIDGANKLFGALIHQDQDATDFKSQADLHAAITLRADMRRHGGGDVVAGQTAGKIVDLYDSGYEIETVSGIRITPEEIMLRRKFSFPAHGKTVDYKAVWKSSANFYNTLVSDGLNA